MFVGGESGIGKTRLLAEAAGIARQAGMGVHRGACPPVAGRLAVPFAPFSSILRSIVRSVDARLIDHLAGPGRRDLATLLPELGDADGAALSGAGSARLFEAILLLIGRAARQSGGLLLVFDDLQWADATALALLSWLVGELRDGRVAIVAAHRTEPTSLDGLPALLAELDRDELVERLELAPLSPRDAETLLAGLADAPSDPDGRRALVRRAGGIPLYLEELSLRPDAQPPASLRLSVMGRLARLDPATRRVVELLATADGTAGVGLLGVACGLPLSAVATALGVANDQDLLWWTGPVSDELDQVAIRHGLIAEAILAGSPADRIAGLHETWADALVGRPDLGPRSPVERTARIARHLLAAGTRERAVPALVAAASAALEARAFEAAHQAYERALTEFSPGMLSPDRLTELLEAAALAAMLAGAPRTALARSAEALGDAEARLSGAALAHRRVRHATVLQWAGDAMGAIDQLERAIPELPAGDARWRALIDLGRALVAAGRPLEAIDRYAAAQSGARRSGLPRLVARAGIALATALSAVGRHDEAITALEHARAIRGTDPERATVVRSRLSRLPDAVAAAVDESALLLRSGDLHAAVVSADAGRRTAADRGLGGAFDRLLVAVGAWAEIRLGRWSAAGASLDPARPDRPGMAGDEARACVAAWLAVSQGRPLESEWPAGGPDPATLGALPGLDWRTIRVQAEAIAAWNEGALLAGRRLIVGHLAGPGPRDPELALESILLGLGIEAEGIRWAEQRGDPAAVEAGREAAAELAIQAHAALGGLDQEVDPGPAIRARRLALRARLIAETGRVAGRPMIEAWESAVEAAAAVGQPDLRAFVQLRLGEALLDSAQDRPRAVDLLREAYLLADGIGAVPLTSAIERLARRARVQLAPAALETGPRAAALAAGLSAREVDVLALIALGHTDREIARELFITEKTAGHHVSHILTKLAVTRRGEAAAMAHRMGLVGLGPPV